MKKLKNKFSRLTRRITLWLGTPESLALNAFILIAWVVAGLIGGFNTTHQLLINTFTTIYTWLMTTILLNTQNRDSRAIHLKLDELLSAKRGARNELISLEEAEDAKLDEIAESFEELKREVSEDR